MLNNISVYSLQTLSTGWTALDISQGILSETTRPSSWATSRSAPVCSLCSSRLGIRLTITDTSDADKSFLQAISKTDPVHDKKRILLFKGPLLWDAFNWIFGHQEFNKWRYTKDSGVFWIKGDPGKGKTMLLCGIIEDLEQNSQNANLGYFFCQATDYRINTASAVVGGLVKSLLKRHPTLLSRIREKYADGVQDQLDGANALVILCDIFETITNDSGLRDVICVVDALDECVKDCKYLLDFIVKTSGHVKWLLSSRNEKHIEKDLDKIPQKLVLELRDNAEKISTSIEAYIRHHIQHIKALKHDEELRVKALNVLNGKAQGTFLWVSLVVEQLHNTDHWEVEDVLEEMPKDLESLYGLILDRTEKLGERGQEVCKALLSIVTTAKRPLHLSELLIFINSHWKNSSYFKTTYQLRDIQDMAKTCGSLLSIREDTVYFIHQSAKDYIMENADQRIFPVLHQHYKMFEASLNAMSDILDYNMYRLEDPAIHIDDVPPKDVSSDPLASIRYCCAFWVEHLVSGYQFEGFDYQKYLKDDAKLHLFLKEKILCWIESLALMRNFSPQAQIALQKLNDLIDCYCCSEKSDETVQATQLQRKNEIQGLRNFVNDAYQFVRNSVECVAHWPLQLYFSAISFQHDNTIRDTFEQTVRRIFGPSPMLASKRHGQSSFRLQSSFDTNRGDYAESKWLIFSLDSSLIGRLGTTYTISEFAVWRADTGALEHTFDITFDSKIAFFPNSHDFISVSENGIIKRWSMRKRSCVGQKSLNLDYWSKSSSPPPTGVSYPKERVIALSPKGDLVASWHRISADGLGFAKIWDTNTACCHISCEHGESVDIYAAFSPNSQLLAVLYRGGFGVHDTKTGAMVQRIDIYFGENYFDEIFGNLYNPDCICFSLNSKIWPTIDQQRQIYLWNTHTWELIRKIKISSLFNRLKCLAISPDSTILATGSSDGTRLWSIETGECVAQVNINPRLIVFPPDWTESSRLALQSRERGVQTWLISNNQAMPEAQHFGYDLDSITISPDSGFVASKRSSKTHIDIWSVNYGQIVHVLEGQFGAIDKANSLPVFSPDSKVLAFSDGLDKIQTWSVVTGQPVCSLICQDKSGISSIALSSEPSCLIVGTFSGKMYIWRIESGELIYQFDIDNQTGTQEEPLLVAISPESAHFAAFRFGLSNYVETFHLCVAQNVEIAYPQKVWTCTYNDYLHFERNKARIAFSSDSAILVIITNFKARIFDVTSGICLQKFALCLNSMRQLSFDAIKGRIFTTESVFYKTSSWKHWQASPRLGYSYDYPYSDEYPCSDDFDDKWITLDGKMNCYLPSNFRLGGSRFIDHSYPLIALSDSLLVIVNELRELVIIKFPNPRETWQQVNGNSDVASLFESTADRVGSSHLADNVSAENNSGFESPIRKRSASNELESWRSKQWFFQR